MNHFLANEWRRAQTSKRGGGVKVLSLDDTTEARYAAEPATDLTPEKLYQRRWAMSLFERALVRLRQYYHTTGKAALYDGVKDFLSADAVDGDYARLGEQLGMSKAAITLAVHRLRQRYRELVREEIAQTVAQPEEVEDEMRSLLAALA